MADLGRIRKWERALLLSFEEVRTGRLRTPLLDLAVIRRWYSGAGLYVDWDPCEVAVEVAETKWNGPTFSVVSSGLGAGDPDEFFGSRVFVEHGRATGLEVYANGYFGLPEGELEIAFL